MRSADRRRGVTVVEVLIAVSILSVLAALLLPAIQQAREGQRRISCVAHLRDIGLACEGYATTHARYPLYIGRVGSGPPAPPFDQPAGHSQLLPYLDQTALFNEVSEVSFGAPAAEPPTLASHEELLAASVPTFLCPSDDIVPGSNSYRACFGTTPGIHATWKPGRTRPPPGTPEALWGILVGARTPAHVTDGLSQTVLYSERLLGDRNPGHATPWRDAYRTRASARDPEAAREMCASLTSADGHDSFLGSHWMFCHYLHTWYNHVLAPNSPVPDCSEWSAAAYQGPMTARSLHPGGVNVVFGDGHVEFVSESVNLDVWRAAATIHGAEHETWPH